MKNWFTTLALSVLLLFTSAAIGTPVIADDRPESSVGEEYLLGIGDVILVQVWKEEELSGEQQIRLDGRISLPLIGDLKAVGVSPEELAAQIEKHYRLTLAEPSVTVTLKQSNQRYYVVGQVQQPGEFPLDSHLTVLQALARSGGFLEWAKTSDIAIIRRDAEGGEKILPFNYDTMLRRGDLSNHLLLAPGDTIVVP